MDQNIEGKKIFFLYPHSVIRDELLDILIISCYEAYTLNDHKRALKLLAKFRDAIMFINIDEGMSEKEWEAYIRGIQENPKTIFCSLGILSYNTDPALKHKYLMDLNVPCGYIQLKLGIKESSRILLSVLDVIEAKGKRKFLRALCADDPTATVNVKSSGTIYYGKILDISGSGMAVQFPKFDNLPINSKVTDIQLKLRGSLVHTDGILVGRRKEQNVYVFLFDVQKMNPDYKRTIQRYIKNSLQNYMDNIKV